MMHLVIFEDGTNKMFAEEKNIPDDDAVTLVLPLSDHEWSLLNRVNEDDRERVVCALGTLLVKSYHRGFSRGRQKGIEQTEVSHHGVSDDLRRGGGPGPRRGFLRALLTRRH